MTIDLSNPGLRILPADVPQATSEAVGSPANGSFSATLKDAVTQVDASALEARYRVSNLIEGDGTDVHDALIAVERADLSFQLMLQVRNKVVQAYQQIAGMQF